MTVVISKNSIMQEDMGDTDKQTKEHEMKQLLLTLCKRSIVLVLVQKYLFMQPFTSNFYRIVFQGAKSRILHPNKTNNFVHSTLSCSAQSCPLLGGGGGGHGNQT